MSHHFKANGAIYVGRARAVNTARDAEFQCHCQLVRTRCCSAVTWPQVPTKNLNSNVSVSCIGRTWGLRKTPRQRPNDRGIFWFKHNLPLFQFQHKKTRPVSRDS
jgi:hypothetical protein